MYAFGESSIEGETPVCHVHALYTACRKESHSLEVECKLGGKLHPQLNMCLKPIVNKYHEGNVKRTLERKLKVFEIAGH